MKKSLLHLLVLVAAICGTWLVAPSLAQNAARHVSIAIGISGASVVATSPADGILKLTDSAGTSFSRLQLGGTTSSFPALKRSSSALEAKVADDSGYAGFNAGSITAMGAAGVFGGSATITNGAGAGITVVNTGLLQRAVYKVTIDRTAFVCNATTCDMTIGTLPAKTAILSTYADLTTTFACTATCTSSTLSMVLGLTAGTNGLLVSFDADAAIGQFGDADAELGATLARATAVQGGLVPAWSATNGVFLRLTSGTGNIGNGAATNLSQGSITFYVVTERMP